MTNIDHAEAILTARHRKDQMEGDGAVGCFDAAAAAHALANAGLLAPEPQIIRTREELANLDPDTLVGPAYQFAPGWQAHAQKQTYRAADARRLNLTWSGPLVVIATGDHVRAARQALEEA